MLNGKVVPLDRAGNLVVEPGMTISFGANGFDPNKQVGLWIYSTPRQLTEVMADVNGVVLTDVVIPSDVPNGNHRLVLTGTNKSGNNVVIGVGIAVGSQKESNSTSRILIAIPVAFAIIIGLLLPTSAIRRRKRLRSN
jgi:hypothetical protein